MYKLIDNKFYETKEVSNEYILELLNKWEPYKWIYINNDSIKFDWVEFKHVDRTNNKDYIQIWKYKVCKENLKAEPNWKDIWEKEWEIYFTQKAAIREAKTQWLIVPTIEQWWQIAKSINPDIKVESSWQNDTSIREKLWFKLSGFRNAYDGKFFNQGDYGFYWSSSEGCFFKFDATQVYPVNDWNPAHGLSVRCIKN